MSIIYNSSITFFALLAFFTNSLSAEDVPNPQYQSWNNYPVGTSMTTKSLVSQGNATVTTTTVTRLISRTEKNLVLSSVVSSNATGSFVTNDPIEKTISSRFPLFPGVDKNKIGRPQDSLESGMETVVILGKKYNAEWYDTKSTTEAGPAVTRTWISMDMPNMVLKAVTEVKAAGKKVIIEVTEIKIP